MKSTMWSGDYIIKSTFEGNSKAGSGFGHGKKFMDVEKKCMINQFIDLL